MAMVQRIRYGRLLINAEIYTCAKRARRTIDAIRKKIGKGRWKDRNINNLWKSLTTSPNRERERKKEREKERKREKERERKKE